MSEPEPDRGSADASEDARIGLLQAGVDAFNRGDAEPALEIFAEDVECYVAPDLMNAGTYRGRDGYLRMVAAWGEAWGSIEAEIIGIEEVGEEHLVVAINQRAVGAGSGVPVAMQIQWLFQFRDGEVLRFHLYSDRETAIAAAESA